LMAWRSSFILTIKDMYFTTTFLVGDNIEIHLVFTLQSNLFTFVSNNYVSSHYSRCLLGEKDKFMPMLKLILYGLNPID
jgi:hypothetical protein